MQRGRSAALISTTDLYTFDGPTRELRNLVQEPNATLLSSRPKPSNVIVGDSAGAGHFLQYRNNSYNEKLTLQLGSASLDGVTVLGDGLWTGADGILTLRRGRTYDTLVWESPVVGSGFGRFVATDQARWRTPCL